MDNFDKNKFVMMFHDAIINKYFNTNIYFAIECFRSIKDISKMKKETEIMEQYNKIKNIIKTHNFIVPNLDEEIYKNVELQEIDNISFSFQKANVVFDGLNDTISQRTLALLNYVYDNVIFGKNINSIFNVINYLLQQKPKDISRDKKTTINIIDILFNVLVYIASTMNKDSHKYALICRELMYFKSTKHTLTSRKKILYICIYVICTQSLDKSKLTIFKNKDPKIEYLFVICENDFNTKIKIEHECNKLHEKIRSCTTKDVNIGKCNIHTVKMDIVKKI